MSHPDSHPVKTLAEAVHVDLSRQLAVAIGAQAGQCAQNAWRTLIAFPELFQAAGRLVEGWFVLETEERVTMNEHVWCELATGQIVDPSVLLLVPETTPVWYFGGLARRWAEAEALEGELFPHVRFDGVHGADGLGHPGYKAARAAARQNVYAFSFAHQPPKEMHFLTAQDGDAYPLAPDRTVYPPIVEGEPLDLALSCAAAQFLPATPRRCWYNAREALLQMPHPFFSASYVEGWLVGQFDDSVRLIEHGWIQTPHTGIVDPTLVVEDLPSRLAYFPGFRRSWSAVQAQATCSLPLARQRHLERALLPYQHACQEALRRGEQLAWQSGLPLRVEPGAVLLLRFAGKTLLAAQDMSWDFPVPAMPSPRVQSILREMEEGIQWRKTNPRSASDDDPLHA